MDKKFLIKKISDKNIDNEIKAIIRIFNVIMKEIQELLIYSPNSFRSSNALIR